MAGRGPARKAPINDLTHFTMSDAALYCNLPVKIFEQDYKSGALDGTYKLRGDKPLFIVALLKDRFHQQAKESAIARRAA